MSNMMSCSVGMFKCVCAHNRTKTQTDHGSRVGVQTVQIPQVPAEMRQLLAKIKINLLPAHTATTAAASNTEPNDVDSGRWQTDYALLKTNFTKSTYNLDALREKKLLPHLCFCSLINKQVFQLTKTIGCTSWNP